MKLTANLSLLYTELPFLSRFAAARNDGFDAVEIQFPYDTPIADIQRALAESNLRCVLINVSAGDLMSGGEGLAAIPGKTAEFAAALVECQAYARALKVKCVNVLPGRCFDANKRASYLATFQNNVLETARHLAPFGIITTFEAINTQDMPDFLISTGRQMLRVLEEVDHPSIKMQFDIYHMAVMGEEIPTFIKHYAADIGHIQFADMPGRHEPGTGSLDFNEIFCAIEESEYDGWVGAEYRPSRLNTSLTMAWKKKLLALECA